MAKKNKQSAKKKIDWKKVLTLILVVGLIVLKLMYGSDGQDEDAGSQNTGSNVVESSHEVDSAGTGENQSGSHTLVENSQGAEVATAEPTAAPESTAIPEPEIPDLSFRSEYLLNQHYEKHGIDMGFASAEEYEAAACRVIANPETLHKLEAEDGDDVYYLESTNEFVVVSKDGYIRTYFLPADGIKYYNRQ